MKKENIAKFIFCIHQKNLAPFYASSTDDLFWEELPTESSSENDISKFFYLDITNYLIETHLVKLDVRALDDLIETLAIFFSKIHAATLPPFFINKITADEGFKQDLEERRWNGNNWMYLTEFSNSDDVDKTFFRKIACYFLITLFSFEIPEF